MKLYAVFSLLTLTKTDLINFDKNEHFFIFFIFRSLLILFSLSLSPKGIRSIISDKNLAHIPELTTFNRLLNLPNLETYAVIMAIFQHFDIIKTLKLCKMTKYVLFFFIFRQLSSFFKMLK